MFRERLASWSALYQFELENLLIDMSLRRGFNVSIVTAGVQYGCTFDSFIGEFERGLNYGLPPICEGNGGNLMPMIHVKDLANMLFVLS
jgi:nucleoside-diphosphate-sugar epimerase